MDEPETRLKRPDWKSILLLQGIVVIYTLSGVAGKLAASHPFLSAGFILWYAAEIAVLGVYALLWQQIIKRFDLSVAYANRAFAIFWTFLWSILLFHEQVRPANVIGIIIVFLGIQLVNTDAR